MHRDVWTKFVYKKPLGCTACIFERALNRVSSCTLALCLPSWRYTFARDMCRRQLPFFIPLFKDVHCGMIPLLLDLLEFPELHGSILSDITTFTINEKSDEKSTIIPRGQVFACRDSREKLSLLQGSLHSRHWSPIRLISLQVKVEKTTY